LVVLATAAQQSQAIGELQRVFVSGDWGRYAAQIAGERNHLEIAG